VSRSQVNPPVRLYCRLRVNRAQWNRIRWHIRTPPPAGILNIRAQDWPNIPGKVLARGTALIQISLSTVRPDTRSWLGPDESPPGLGQLSRQAHDKAGAVKIGLARQGTACMTTIAQLIASASPHGGSARRPGHGKTRTQLTPQLVNLLESQNDLDPGGFEALREQLNALRASDAFQMETTPAGIDHALTQLVQFDGHSRTPLDGASSGPARRVEPVAARSQAPGQRFPVRRPA
jgi:hypothetical protein